MRLMTRILELRSKINSQINSLNNTAASARAGANGIPKNREHKVEEELRWLLKTNKPECPANFKSLKINYGRANYHLVPDEESQGDWKLATTIHGDRLTGDDPRQCDECKYKEGLEEVLNILAVCGFIRRGEEKSEAGTPPKHGLDDLDPLQDYRRRSSRRSTSAYYY